MDRVIDLSKYYPPAVKDTENFQELAKAENPEFNLAYQKIKEALMDAFIEDATENGIKRYETILKIYPKASDTLDDRKAAILLKYNLQIPYTYRTLEEKLRALFGADGFKLELLNNEYTLNIEIFSNKWNVFDYTINNLREIIPCNLILNSRMIDKMISDLNIGTVHLIGEEITIYPFSARTMENRVPIDIKIAQGAGAETITTYPKRRI